MTTCQNIQTQPAASQQAAGWVYIYGGVDAAHRSEAADLLTDFAVSKRHSTYDIDPMQASGKYHKYRRSPRGIRSLCTPY